MTLRKEEPDMYTQVVRLLTDVDGRKIELYGYTRGRKCKECKFYYKEQYSKVYRRCEKYPKKNWKANLEACSVFKEKVL